MLRQIAVGALLATFGAAGLLSAQQPAGAPPVPPVKRNILQRTDIPGTNVELIYANLEIAPGFKAGRHSHPGVVMAQVVEGEFWIQFDGQPEQVLRDGESLTLPDRSVHNEGSTDKGAKLVVVYVVEKGKPLISPVN